MRLSKAIVQEQLLARKRPEATCSFHRPSDSACYVSCCHGKSSLRKGTFHSQSEPAAHHGGENVVAETGRQVTWHPQPGSREMNGDAQLMFSVLLGPGPQHLHPGQVFSPQLTQSGDSLAPRADRSPVLNPVTLTVLTITPSTHFLPPSPAS